MSVDRLSLPLRCGRAEGLALAIGLILIGTSLLLAYERPRAISHLVASLTGVPKKVV